MIDSLYDDFLGGLVDAWDDPAPIFYTNLHADPLTAPNGFIRPGIVHEVGGFDTIGNTRSRLEARFEIDCYVPKGVGVIPAYDLADQAFEYVAGFRAAGDGRGTMNPLLREIGLQGAWFRIQTAANIRYYSQ